MITFYKLTKILESIPKTFLGRAKRKTWKKKLKKY